MPFKYSCFVSYPGTKRQEMRDFIDAIKRELEYKIDPFLDEEVFIDQERLKGGDFYNEVLAQALCHSLCMIMVFTPKYFNKNHLFCVREYKAMERIEQVRFTQLNLQRQSKFGLIIPIIYRGPRYFPQEIKSKRHYYDFSAPNLTGASIGQNEKCVTALNEIAERIYEIYQICHNNGDDLFAGCNQFRLPTENEVKHWQKQVQAGPMPFPDFVEDLK